MGNRLPLVLLGLGFTALGGFAEGQLSYTQRFDLVGSLQDSSALSATSSEKRLYPQSASHFVLVPQFAMSDGFQADSRLDVLAILNTNSPSPLVLVKEAYLDFLMSDFFRVRGGYMKSDLGYNGTFHPLNVTEMSSAFSEKFPTVNLGNDSMISPGFPSVGVSLSSHWGGGEWRVAWESLVYFLSSTDVEENYYLERLSLNGGNWAAGLVAGIQPESSQPTYGGYLSWVTPSGVNLFWEGLLKTTKARAATDAGALVLARSNESALNQSIRAEYSGTDPLWGNDLSLSAEYFSYGEGLTNEEYDELVDYARTHSAFQDKRLFISHRNFRDYGAVGFGYGNSLLGISASYQAVVEFASWLVSHSLEINRAVGNATLAASLTFQQTDQERYLLSVHGERLTYRLTFSMDL